MLSNGDLDELRQMSAELAYASDEILVTVKQKLARLSSLGAFVDRPSSRFTRAMELANQHARELHESLRELAEFLTVSADQYDH